jgi:hypothetical protein
MPTVDDYGYDFDLPPDPGEVRRGGSDLRTWRARLREQGREIRELRAALAAAEAAAEPAETPDTVGEAGPPDQAALVAELDEVRRATAEAEAQYATLAREPVGVSPEDRQAQERVQAALDGAMPQVDGLDGVLAMLRDKSMPWPAQQEVMRAFGFRDAPPS